MIRVGDHPGEASASPRRQAARAFPVLVLVLAFAHFPLFLGSAVFTRDVALELYPRRQFVGEAFRHGQSTLWNPRVALGYPTLSNPLYAPLYPPYWPLLLASGTQLARALSWSNFTHVVWGALGFFLLMRKLGGSSRAGLVAGLTWALSGYTASTWVIGVMLVAGAWLPWCSLGFVTLVRDASNDRLSAYARAVPKAALPVAMAWLLGEVFSAVMAIGLGLVLAVIEARGIFVDGHAYRHWLRRLGALLVAVGLGTAAGGGAVVLPANAVLQDTERSQPLPRAAAETFSLHPLRLVELVAPEALGNPDAHYPGARIVGEESTTWPYLLSVYLGAATMVLVLVAFRRRGRAASVIGALGVIALAVALGRYFVAHRVLRWLVPPLAYMRSPEKYLIFVVFAVALLAGWGMDRISASGFRVYKRSLVFLGGLAALAATAGLWFAPDLAQVIAPACWRGAAAAGLMTAVVALGQRRPSWATPVLVTILAVDLAMAAWPRLSFGPADLALAPPVVAAIRQDADRDGQRALPPPRVYRVEAVERSVSRLVPATSVPEGQRRGGLTLVPNLAAAFGLAAVPGYDAAIPKSFTTVWEAQPDVVKLMRLLAVDYVIAPVDDPQAPVSAPDGLVAMMDPAPGARLFKAAAPLPRVFLAAHADVVPEPEALARLGTAEVLAGHLVLLAPSATARALAGPLRSAGTCRMTSYTNTRIEAQCEADKPAFAVFVEQYHSGWRAEVDQHPVPLERANLIGRAVRLTPGSHRVVLTFTSAGQLAGFAVSGLGLLGLGCCFLLARIRGGRGRHDSDVAHGQHPQTQPG